MTGYTKLFPALVTSTVWRESSDTRVVWITLLALADRDGIVECSVPGLADMARVEVETCRECLQRLQEPDPDSRTQEHDGRRIAPVDGGFLILNHAKYRARLSRDERREYKTEKQREYRSRTKRPHVSTISTSGQSGHIAEAEAEAEAEAHAQETRAREGFDELGERAGQFCTWYRWELYPETRSVPYTPSATVERSDLDAATRLAMSYSDDEMRQLAEFFLHIPADRERFVKGKQRTVSMLLSMAGPIMEKLRAS